MCRRRPLGVYSGNGIVMSDAWEEVVSLVVVGCMHWLVGVSGIGD